METDSSSAPSSSPSPSPTRSSSLLSRRLRPSGRLLFSRSSLRASTGSSSSSNNKVDIHIRTLQGNAHIADNIPNQDMAFAVAVPTATLSLSSFVTPLRHRRRARVAAAGIFDGHGELGHIASRLACKRMQSIMDTILLNDIHLETTLVSAFREVSAVLDGAKCGDGSGTTGSVVAIYNDTLCAAWVGDSVIAVIDDTPTPHIRFASGMHRPSDPSEAARVTEQGGCIVEGYVTDKEKKTGIAVTRTLGDIDMHQYGCISTPQCATLQLSDDDAVVIIASDGLWDTQGVTTDTVLRICAQDKNNASKKKKRTARRVINSLVEAVEEADGPTDDCTIACITLR